MTIFAVEKNHENYELATSPLPMAAIIKDYPEVETVIRLKKNFGEAAVCEDKNLIVQGYYVDKNFTEVFSFMMTAGDPSTALLEPYSIVLTSKLAEKFFGLESPLGKIIQFPELGDFKVTGILPALSLSRLQPINFLKDITQLRSFSRMSLRKALVVTQFCISLVLIIFLCVGYKQSMFLKNFDYRFNTEYLECRYH